MICVFFGHRFILESEKVEAQLKRVVENLIQEGVDTFWLGGYGEFDAMATKITKKCQAAFPHIKRVLVLPYLPTNKEEYQLTRLYYDEIFLPEGVEIGPPKFAIIRRNRYMVANADIVVTCVDRKTGGAAQALKQAKHLKKRVIELSVNALSDKGQK